MSDVRALLAGRGIEVGDGAYLERADPPVSAIEEMLRGWTARLTLPQGRSVAAFLHAAKALEAELAAMADDDLRDALRRWTQPMRRQGFQDALIAPAFAVVREAARRALGLRHYDVQLLAGRALLQGRIAEMATGEGKTLAATLATCTAAATGAAVHVVTVNDYLASRDAQDNAPLFALLGLSVGTIKQGMAPEERRVEYARDLVYVSNKELTFDYLKDRIALGATLHSHQTLRALHSPRAATAGLLRGLHVAIVDEADSVLIDEARTPLIISETLPDELGEPVYAQALALAGQLTRSADFIVGQDRSVWLTEPGQAKVQAMTVDFDGVWQSPLWRRELAEKALSALHSFHRDQHYIVAEDKVQIVDEFTGRVMPDRSWERGLHQMIEAKEGCAITGQRKTLSQITYQRFFGRYLLLAGMTGTAKEVESELKRVYDLSVVRIPTHKPSQRLRLADQVFRTGDERWRAVARRAEELAAAGRAVLVGTRSVEASERLGGLLAAQGTAHTILNARQDKDEAAAVAQAGQAGRITVATNMAGRGTDIKLAPAVAEAGGLHVILTEFHESPRVDRQLFGRAARQGDPGSVEAIVSLDDELFRRYAAPLAAAGSNAFINGRQLGAAFFNGLVRFAQARAERRNRKIRLETIQRDRKWLQALGFVGRERK